MLQKKCLSIITNFGCHYKCPYCIVKNNGLKIPRTTIKGLSNLKNEIAKHDIGMISISGGGDPLHNISNTKEWYSKFFEIVGNLELELHTTYLYKDKNKDLYSKFHRCVYHIINVEDIRKIKNAGSEIIRVVFVVSENFNEDKILKIVEECKKNNVITELSFRQMVDSNYQTTHYCQDFLEKGHKKDWYYVKQNDYNIYYAENKVSYKYEDFKGE